MNNTYYVLSMGWMHSRKLQITVCVNLHIIGKSANVLCTQNSVALRYTQLSPATAVLLWHHETTYFASKNFPLAYFQGPNVPCCQYQQWAYHLYNYYRVHVICVSCTCRAYCSCHVHRYWLLTCEVYIVCSEGFPPTTAKCMHVTSNRHHVIVLSEWIQ